MKKLSIIHRIRKKLAKNVLAVSLILTILACLAAIILKLYTEKELLFQIFAASLGLIFTAVITMLLLEGQTEEQRKADISKENSQKVYEEKLKIYKSFLSILYSILKDNKIEEEEKVQLIFETASITMHTSAAHVATISEAVNKLVSLTNRTSFEEGEREREMLEALFNIVHSFRMELYTSFEDREKEWQAIREAAHSKAQREAEKINERGETPAKAAGPAEGNISFANELKHSYHAQQVDDIRRAFAQAFSDIEISTPSERDCRKVEPLREKGGDSAEDVLAVSFAAHAATEDAGGGRSRCCSTPPSALWTEAFLRWQRYGWEKTQPKEEGHSVEFWLSKKDILSTFEVGFYDGHYYLQATFEKDDNFSRAMKWEYKGRRSYGTWWKHFEGQFYHMERGDFSERIQWDKKLQQYLIERIETIMAHLESQYESYMWLMATRELLKAKHPDWLEENANWRMHTFYWHTLNSKCIREDEGDPFIDARREDDHVVIELDNGYQNKSLLPLTLRRFTPVEQEENKRPILQRIPTSNRRNAIDLDVAYIAERDRLCAEVAQVVVAQMERLNA